MPRRAPFIPEGLVAIAFAMGLLFGWGLMPWACASAIEQKATDVVTIEGKDLACLLANATEPDDVIVQRCAPAGDTQKAISIQVDLAICHAHRARDAGAPDGAEGNLWTLRSRRLAFSSRVWPARSP